MTLITSTANDKIKRIRSLSLKKHRDTEGVFILEGAEHIQKALAHGWQIETLLFTSDVKEEITTQTILKTCQAQHAFLYEVTDKVTSYASNRDNAQPVIGIFKQRYAALKAISTGLWLGLENIRDPGNLGTIIRTADAIGVEGIILISNTCDAFAPEVIRATTGSFSAVPLIQTSIADFLSWRKHFTGRLIGTHLHQKSIDYRELTPQRPTLLLMGSEQSGLSNELTETCDILAKIPMREGVESLNLAIATGVMLYRLSA